MPMLHQLNVCLTPASIPHLHTALVDENAFVDWLIDARPGHRIIYYRGHLAHDRMPSARVMDNRSRAVVHTVSNRVMTSADKGLVLPVQQRLGPGDYLYIAVKARPPRAAERRSKFLALSIGSNFPAVTQAIAMPALLAA
jgi:hypothetical protein